MATAAQITANRANAARSTGPRTCEGLTATHLVVREDERQEFEDLRASLVAEPGPRGAVETLTFNDLLHAAWNLHRFRRLEAERGSDPAAFDDPAAAAFLDRLGRYQVRAQRAWRRTPPSPPSPISTN